MKNNIIASRTIALTSLSALPLQATLVEQETIYHGVTVFETRNFSANLNIETIEGPSDQVSVKFLGTSASIESFRENLSIHNQKSCLTLEGFPPTAYYTANGGTVSCSQASVPLPTVTVTLSSLVILRRG